MLVLLVLAVLVVVEKGIGGGEVVGLPKRRRHRGAVAWWHASFVMEAVGVRIHLLLL